MHQSQREVQTVSCWSPVAAYTGLSCGFEVLMINCLLDHRFHKIKIIRFRNFFFFLFYSVLRVVSVYGGDVSDDCLLFFSCQFVPSWGCARTYLGSESFIPSWQEEVEFSI